MPRRKKTETPEGLPDLTPQQLKFCEGILAGLSQRKAYRAAYGCGSMSVANIDCEASRLRHSPKIAPWLDAVRFAACVKARARTLEEHVARLENLAEIGIRSGNLGAAVQAEINIGKACGLYVEQHADVTYEPLRTLKQIAEHEPELARKLAVKHNIPLDQLETSATRH